MILQGSKDRKSASGYALLEVAEPNFHKRRTVFFSRTKPDYSPLIDLIRVKNVIGR